MTTVVLFLVAAGAILLTRWVWLPWCAFLDRLVGE